MIELRALRMKNLYVQYGYVIGFFYIDMRIHFDIKIDFIVLGRVVT